MYIYSLGRSRWYEFGNEGCIWRDLAHRGRIVPADYIERRIYRVREQTVMLAVGA